MKRIFTILAAVLLTASVFLPQQAGAQSPEKMSYQAVVRDAGDNLVTSSNVGMQISILQGSANGTPVYVETQTPATNANGLVTIEIGTGTTSDDFSAINWANGPCFIKTETDPAGGTNYTITGTSQLLSVPYALHAKTAENITGTIIETDPVFTGSQAANITSTDITNLGNLSGTNTGDQDLSNLATQTALEDTASDIRADIPDVSGFVTTETDPVFSAWDKSTGISITESQISDLDHFTNVDETDPVFGASIASGITGTDTTNWNNKLDSYTETDPVFSAWDKNTGISITESQISDLDHFTNTDEADPTFTASQAANITSTNITNLGNLSCTNTGDQDLSNLALKSNVIELNNTTAFIPDADYEPATKKYVDELESQVELMKSVILDNSLDLSILSVQQRLDWGETPYQIYQSDNSLLDSLYGKTYQEGLIFYLNTSDGTGLVAAPSDQSTGARWGCLGTAISGADGIAIGTGTQNTIDIEAGCTTAGTAADICANLTLGGYSDWFLPSKDELNAMYTNLYLKDYGAFANSSYWSSTEYTSTTAWRYYFTIGASYFTGKSNTYRVRAVRTF